MRRRKNSYENVFFVVVEIEKVKKNKSFRLTFAVLFTMQSQVELLHTNRIITNRPDSSQVNKIKK